MYGECVMITDRVSFEANIITEKFRYGVRGDGAIWAECDITKQTWMPNDCYKKEFIISINESENINDFWNNSFPWINNVEFKENCFQDLNENDKSWSFCALNNEFNLIQLTYNMGKQNNFRILPFLINEIKNSKLYPLIQFSGYLRDKSANTISPTKEQFLNNCSPSFGRCDISFSSSEIKI